MLVSTVAHMISLVSLPYLCHRLLKYIVSVRYLYFMDREKQTVEWQVASAATEQRDWRAIVAFQGWGQASRGLKSLCSK